MEAIFVTEMLITVGFQMCWEKYQKWKILIIEPCNVEQPYTRTCLTNRLFGSQILKLWNFQIMEFTLFDSANPHDLSMPDLNFINECIHELPENADYNALDICLGEESNNGPSSGFSDFLDAPNLSDTPNIIQSCLDPRLTSTKNNSTLPEQRSINAVSIESHSNPDVDSLVENNHQGL